MQNLVEVKYHQTGVGTKINECDMWENEPADTGGVVQGGYIDSIGKG